MKKIAIMLVFVMCFLSGCNTGGELDVEKYAEYKCFDYHLACLDAYEKEAKTTVEYDGIKYSIWYRKPVGESDEQFICAKVRQRHPLSAPDIVVMQNPTDYIDVFSDWTVKKIELYYQDPKDPKKTKQLWEEKEPARTPAGVLSTTTDTVVFDEFVEFIINSDYSEKNVSNGISSELPNDDYNIYIRVYFNESENIVWESDVYRYVSSQSKTRNLAIDKGRAPSGIASPHSLYVSIEDFPNLLNWISTTIEDW